MLFAVHCQLADEMDARRVNFILSTLVLDFLRRKQRNKSSRPNDLSPELLSPRST